MRTKSIFIILVSVCTLIIIGILVLAKQLFENGYSTDAIGGIMGSLALAAVFSVLIKKIFRDIKLGLPMQDERSQKIKMHAAGYAYFISLYIWLAIMIFQKYFDRDDLLITGLLGMVISFGMSWVLFSKKRGLE